MLNLTNRIDNQMQTRDIVIGLDIGGTKTKIGLVNRQGKVLVHSSFSSRSQEDFSAFLSSFSKELDRLRAIVQNPLTLLGVGIGAPNANFYKGTMENPVNFKWGVDVPIVKAVSDLLDVPAVITNDANAAAVGEMRFGRAKGMKDFHYLRMAADYVKEYQREITNPNAIHSFP